VRNVLKWWAGIKNWGLDMLKRALLLGVVATFALLSAQVGRAAAPSPTASAAIIGNADCTITVEVQWKNVRISSVEVGLETYDLISPALHLYEVVTFNNARSAGKLSFTSVPEPGPQCCPPLAIITLYGPRGLVFPSSVSTTGTFCGLLNA
jgi:hypothetical protein